jgi:glyoxylase-like metal-dependent hydrolase (beta-lactamase superfamily II)
MTREPVDLGGGVRQYQTALWQTNAVLVGAGRDTLLCDPSWEPAEIADLRQAAERDDHGATYIAVTHADYDHTCGIGSFPGATVVAGAETAERIRSGAAARELADASAEWGLAWVGEPRVDRVVGAGDTVELGSFRVAAIDARGHVADGLAWILLDQGVLLTGDYLAAMSYPFVIDSVANARATIERLLRILDEHDLRWVVPGHGPALVPAEARRIGEEDLAYLDRLAAAAREARAAGLSRGHALVRVWSVEPPRPTTPDFDLFDLRGTNARAALAGAA